jgi:NAD(P)-dependent dehydrogenase (short-subunit alcohol dehydrogenase family)
MSPPLAGKVVLITGATSGMGRVAARRIAAEGATVVAAGRDTAAGEGGGVVNNASIGGVKGIPGMASYVAAKHGVIGLTTSVALEWAERKVRVNALVTGNVDTPLYRRLMGMGPDDPGDLPAPNPSKRVAAAEEIAGFVAYLLRDEAAFITGAELAIDGGDTAS